MTVGLVGHKVVNESHFRSVRPSVVAFTKLSMTPVGATRRENRSNDHHARPQKEGAALQQCLAVQETRRENNCRYRFDRNQANHLEVSRPLPKKSG